MAAQWQAISDPSRVIWLGYQPDPTVRWLLSKAMALVMPAQEDFGITALEAAASGTPVIIHSQSGVAELLPAQTTSIQIDEETIPALVAAIKDLETTRFDTRLLTKIAQKYATTRFVRQWQELVENAWQRHAKGSL